MPELLHIPQILLLVAGGTFLLGQMLFRPAEGTRPRRFMLVVAAIVGLLSVASYTKWGQFNDLGRAGRHVFHYHDIWHYALGAKYYPELGYNKQYNCTAVALDEMKAEGKQVPPIDQIRVLASPMDHFVLAREMPRLKEECHTSFSEQRWAAFKADQGVWLHQIGQTPNWWKTMLFDLGFNPPPTWNVVAHTTLDWVPLSPTALELWPFLDMGLILLVGGALVWRTWGPFALTGYLLVFGTNYLASYSWTGGSYMRQLWFAALVAGLATLERKHWRLAGVLLALSACMRIFPAVFIAGAGLALLGAWYRGEVERKAVLEFTAAGVATGLVMVGLSLALFDPQLWVDFLHKIRDHGDTYFVWHIGFKKWATWGPGVAGQDFWWGAGLVRFQAWNDMLNATWEASRWTNEGLRFAMMGSAAALSWRLKPTRAALFLGGTVMFCMTIPANYYYVWLALIPAVWYDEDGRLTSVFRMGSLFATLALIASSRWIHRDALIQNAWWNWAMMGFFCAWIATVALERDDLRALAGGLWQARKKELVALGLAAAAVTMAVRSIDLDPRKNLVVILIDTIRADRLGTYGYTRPTTPRIDRWAEKSTVFEHAYAHAPWTAPSVAAIMTSMVPRDHGLVDWNMSLDTKHLTLAEHLKTEGYQTMAAISHVVFRPELGFNQGFDDYNTRALQLGHPERAVSSKLVADVAIGQIKNRRRGQPFFLWAHFFDPHFQYIAHKGMEYATPAEQKKLPEIQRWSNNYDSEVRFTDHHVGRIFQFLEDQGLAEDTVVALVGDHGEEFGDHGGQRHSVQMWDEVTRVPLILRAPGVKPGRYEDTLATSDLGPTVLPLLGVPTPEAFDGRPVEATADGFASDGHRDVVIETIRFADKRAWVRWPWKVVDDRKAKKVSLFNLETDPLEKTDVAAGNPEVRDDLLEQIRLHYEGGRAEGPARVVSEEERKQLEALGYVEEDDHGAEPEPEPAQEKK